MKAISKIATGVVVTAFMGAAVYIALTPGPADAGYGVAPAPEVTSNVAAKGDRLESRRAALPNTVEVAEIHHEGEDFVLVDAEGREVYRSNRTMRTTTVDESADVPLLTGLGVATSRPASTAMAD